MDGALFTKYARNPGMETGLRETERGQLMHYFLEKLNPGRARDGFKPLTMARMGKVLEMIPTKDLYYLKRVCEDSQHFAKRFWWELNPQKHGNLMTDIQNAV